MISKNLCSYIVMETCSVLQRVMEIEYEQYMIDILDYDEFEPEDVLGCSFFGGDIPSINIYLKAIEEYCRICGTNPFTQIIATCVHEMCHVEQYQSKMFCSTCVGDTFSLLETMARSRTKVLIETTEEIQKLINKEWGQYEEPMPTVAI